jgi:alkanesulfonate monooxygenase SsuD/methylene tetrahydromethanopterin reductase-like flavin-dependent oxidoreductase (luciferase family)
MPLDAMKQVMESLRSMAVEAGRNPNDIEIIVRANIHQTPEPLGRDRPIFYGSLDQIAADAAAARDLGVAEIFVDPTFSPAGESLDGFLSTMEQMRAIL